MNATLHLHENMTRPAEEKAKSEKIQNQLVFNKGLANIIFIHYKQVKME